MQIALQDPAVQAALINAVGYITAAIIAAVCAAVVGQQFMSRKRLLEKLELAKQDVQFLLHVEREHCSMHKASGSESNKIRVRNLIRDRGLSWSGRFTGQRS